MYASYYQKGPELLQNILVHAPIMALNLLQEVLLLEQLVGFSLKMLLNLFVRLFKVISQKQ